MTIYRLSEKCAVATQIRPADVAGIADQGFTAVICNRPDDEDPTQPPAQAIAAACGARGLGFAFIPIGRDGLSKAMVEAFRRAVEDSGGPVLAYCRSGQRSSVIWQASGSP